MKRRRLTPQNEKKRGFVNRRQKRGRVARKRRTEKIAQMAKQASQKQTIRDRREVTQKEEDCRGMKKTGKVL